MTDNRLRDQFSATGSLFGDPLVLAAAVSQPLLRFSLNPVDERSPDGAQLAADVKAASDSHLQAPSALADESFRAMVAQTAHATGESSRAAAAVHYSTSHAAAAIERTDLFVFNSNTPAALPSLHDVTAPSATASAAPAATPIYADGLALAGREGLLHALPTHASAAGTHAAPPPVSPTVYGQLWYGGQGADGGTSSGSSDNQVGHIDSDQSGRDVSDVDTQDSDAGFQAIGLDTSAGLYFALDGSGLLRSGHITNDTETNEASQFGTTINSQSGTELQLTDSANGDEDNAFAVDPVHHVIYTEIWGKDDNTTAIIKISYNATTGVMTSPYNSSTGTLSSGSTIISNTSTGGVLTDVTAMSYDIATGNLYYVDDDLGYSHNGGAGASWSASKNIYVVNTSTDALTQLTTGLNAADANTYIAGMAVDEAKGIIYYSIDNASALTTQIYWMPITGGAGTAMGIPGGVTLGFETYFGNGSNGMAIDQNSQTLYIGNSYGPAHNTDGNIVQLTLSADGHSFTGGNSSFEVFDNNGNNANTGALVFDNLPVLNNISGTTTEAVQGGSAIALLGAAPNITDRDNVHLASAQVVIANAQSGDVLAATTTGTSITSSYNSTTHTLTLTGDDTLADYQTVLDSVTFHDTGTDNSTGSHPTRTLDWIISDGTTIVDQSTSDSNEVSTTLVIDRAPVVVSDSNTDVEGATVNVSSPASGVLANDSDKDGDTLTISAISGGTVGTSTPTTYGHVTLNADGSYTYLADNTSAIDAAPTGSHPVDVINFTVSDGQGGTTNESLSITLDRAPTVVTDSGAAVEAASGTGNVLTNDSDKDGDTLTVSAVNGGAGNVGSFVSGTYGQITISANGSYTYNANNTSAIDGAATGSHPTDTFSYTANDGHGGTTTTNIVITLDRAPTVVLDAGAAVESSSGTGNVLTNDSDRDGDTLAVSAVNALAGNVGHSVAGTYGHLTLNSDGSYTYQADNTAAIDGAATGSHLTDTFSYQASDGFGGTTTTNLIITLDRAPTVVADAGTALESFSGTGNVLTNDSDRDGDTLTVSAVNGVAGNVGASVAGTYGELTLNSDGSYTYQADQTSAIDSAATGSHPTDTFTYQASDGHGGFTTTNLVITLDRAPTVVADTGAAVESSSGTGNVLSNDSDRDGDTLTVSAVNGVAGNVGNSVAGTYGELTLNSDGSYTYQADQTAAIDSAATGSHLTDTFSYTADDGQGGTTTTNLVITLDRAPTVVADTGSAVESFSGTGNVLTNDSDRDGDSLTVSAVNGVAGNVGASVAGTYGELTLNGDGSYTYQADNTSAIDSAATGSHLTDTFSYTADDGFGGTTTTALIVTLDRAPTVVSDASSSDAVESGAAVTGNVLTNDSDRDGDSLTVSAVNGVAGNVGASVAGTYGELTLNSDGSYTYVADNTSAIDSAATGSHLTDTFSYTADDGFGGLTTTNLVITLDRAPTVVNDNVAIAESASVSANAASGVLSDDSDRDGDSLTITKVDGSAARVGISVAGAYGHLTLNADGSYTYAADKPGAINLAPTGSHPVDTFTFTVSDGQGGTTNETLSFTIDRPPVAHSDSLTTFENAVASATTVSTGVLNNDVDPDTGDDTGITVTAVNGVAGNVGTQITLASGALLTLNTDGTYSYDPNHAFDYLPAASSGANSVAFDHFTYTIDGGSTVTVTITIHGVDSNDTLQGTTGNDDFSGGIGNDTFNMQGGGTDIVNGDSGNDVFYFDGKFSAADQVDGGTGFDRLSLNGQYTGLNKLVFNATTLVNVEAITLVTGHDYNITTNDATVAAGKTLAIHASGLGLTDSLTFDGSAETDGRFEIYAGAGSTNVTGGAGNDVFFLSPAASVIAHGGGGNDVFYLAGSLTASDQIDGGSGNDRLVLNGDYSGGVTFNASTMTNIEQITLGAGHSYSLTLNDANVAAGQTLTVNAAQLGVGDSLTFDGSNETDGRFVIHAGAGTDTLTGGAGSDIISGGNGIDVITGGGGKDYLTGGSGSDTFVYNAVSDSTGVAHDVITGFNAAHDVFELNGINVLGIDATVSSGELRNGLFDSDLSAAVGASQMGAHDAVLFTPTSGSYAGHTILVIDVNGVAGYQAGQDLVIDLHNATNLNLTTANFI